MTADGTRRDTLIADADRPTPGADPGACPSCGGWRKAAVLDECPKATASLIAAVLRDASHYRTHRLTTGSSRVVITSYHVTRDGGNTTACGRLGAEFTIEADLSKVPDHRRCKRPGCRQGWPT